MNLSLILILIAGLALRLFAASDLFLHDWDERFHALVAKNMMDAPFKPMLYVDPALAIDYKNWSANHIWLHKQPFPLWAMAGSMKLFGVHEITLRLPSILLSTLAIYLTFRIGTRLFNKKLGLLAAFLHSINGLVIELTGGRIATDHIDVFFLCLIELAIFFSILSIEKKKTGYQFLTGIALGLAILTKWLPALIVLPIWFLLAKHSRKFTLRQLFFQFLLIVLVAMLVAMPWQLYIYSRFPLEAKWESQFNWLHIIKALEGNSGNVFYHFNKMRIHFGELVYLPLAWFIYRLIKRKSLKMLALTIWVFVPYLFFSLVQTKMQAYTLFSAPAIFIIISWHCLILLKKPLYFNHRKLSSAIFALLILLPIRYSFERVKPFHNRERNPAWAKELRKLGERTWPEKTVIFNIERPVEAMFYGNFSAYEILPDRETVQSLLRKNYKVVIKKDMNVIGQYSGLPGIELIQ